MAAFDWQDGAKGAISADGDELEAASFGPAPGEQPTIVLLHEGLGSVSQWRDLPQRLSETTGYGVFAYSRAGYGQSSACRLPRPVDYMTREAMNVLPNVLDAIGFEHGILLGHSDGATIAAIHAGMSGDMRIRGVALIAPHFFVEQEGLTAIAAAKTAYEEGDLKEKLARHHADVDCAFRGWNDAWLNPEFRDWNVAECIDYLRVPVLAVQGRDDAYGTLAQIRELEERIYSPLDVEIIEECGHAPHIEYPERTLAILSEFAKRLQRIEDETVEIR